MRPRPLNHRALVKVLDDEAERIWLPEGYSRSLRGMVISSGPASEVDEGDEVLFDRGSALVIRVPNEHVNGGAEELYLVPGGAILCVLDPALVT